MSTSPYADSAGRGPGAVNWDGDLAGLPYEELTRRERSIAEAIAAQLYNDGSDPRQAHHGQRAPLLRLYAECRQEVEARQEDGRLKSDPTSPWHEEGA